MKNSCFKKECLLRYKKAKHSFKDISKKGTVIEEISSFSNKEDSYYTDLNIHQNIKRKSL